MDKHKSPPLGVLLVGHGSRDEEAIASFHDFADDVRAALSSDVIMSYGYLEFATPVLHDAIASLAQQGCRHIIALPVMLFAAGHVKNDVPSALRESARQHDVTIEMARDLSLDHRLIQLSCLRIEEALAHMPSPLPRHDQLLMVVGRGSSDPDANGNVSKVARLLQENMGFGWLEVAYSGVTFPLTRAALSHAIHLPFKQIIVFPYFLFTGILVKRIYEHSQQIAAGWQTGEIICAPYLNRHELLTQTALERLQECLSSSSRAVMNCHLCKYRVPMPAFAHEVGLPQAGHHHHVEGLLANGHDHVHHSHGHDDRPPYPHHDHPLGPSSLKRASRADVF